MAGLSRWVSKCGGALVLRVEFGFNLFGLHCRGGFQTLPYAL